MTKLTVPQTLVEDIIAGRCVAFVGAGFSSEAAPTWKDLLATINQDGPNDPKIAAGIQNLNSAMDYEAIAEHLKSSFGDGEAARVSWEQAVQSALQEKSQQSDAMDARKRMLAEIPFSAVLTTNFDNHLVGHALGPELYARVLREQNPWWRRAERSYDPNKYVVKMHGDANGKAESPVVFARTDYRNLLYEDSKYANFIRAVFATHSVLFLGVSFTDAYLNELRSEVLALIGPKPRGRPWGYAIVPDRDELAEQFFMELEGIKLLTFEIGRDDEEGKPLDFSGFDRWLEAIHEQTSMVARLRTMIRNQNVIWIDPAKYRNQKGYDHLKAAGANLVELSASELDEDRHKSATLIISNYGYKKGNDPAAFDVLNRVSRWTERPPVVVFASGGVHAVENRKKVLRRGAWEYASRWDELFRLLQTLFGRL